MTAAPSHLFVYGSLRCAVGHPMARLLHSSAHYVGEGWFAGRLYDLGPYPAAIATPESPGRVWGEVYRLGRLPRLLEALDRYENGSTDNPGEPAYGRRPVEVRLARGGRILAWTYLYLRNVTGYRVVSDGDYVAYRSRAMARVNR